MYSSCSEETKMWLWGGGLLVDINLVHHFRYEDKYEGQLQVH